MTTKTLKTDGLTTTLEVTVPANDINAARQTELQKLAKDVSLPGFRKGKVPLKVVEAKYGQAVMGDVLQSVVGTSTEKAIKENNLRPAFQPKIEVQKFDLGQDLVFTMTVENLPEVKIMDLKTIQINKPVAKVADDVVAQALDRVAAQNGEAKDLDAPRATQKDDQLTLDFTGKTADGTSLPGMSATDFSLRLGSNSLIPGFEDQLIGKNQGDVVDVQVTFPDDYHEKTLAGKPATFVTTIKKVQAYQIPAIDDDFGKKLGFPDLAGLRKAVENQLSSDYNRFTRQKVKRALLDVLDVNHKLELPATLVDMEYQTIAKQMESEKHAEAHAQGDHHHDDHNHEHHSHLTDEEKTELRTIAERRVRLGLVLAEIGKTNNITVNDGELQRAIFAEAGKYPGQERQVLEFYRKNRQALESLRAPIFEEKVVDFILELAQVTEVSVSVDDLLKDDDAPVADDKADKKEKKSKKK